MKKENLKPIMFRATPSDYELFKKICEAKGTKASIKLRELMKDYIRENTNILNEILMKKGEQNVWLWRNGK